MEPGRSQRMDPGVVALGWVSFLSDVASDMIYPLLPDFLTRTLHAGPAALGLIEGVAEATASLMKVASGWWSDRVRRRKPIVVARLFDRGASRGPLDRPRLELDAGPLRSASPTASARASAPPPATRCWRTWCRRASAAAPTGCSARWTTPERSAGRCSRLCC